MAAPQVQPQSIRTAWLVSVAVADNLTLYFTTAPFDISYLGNTYQSNGPLYSVGRLADNIKSSDTTLSIAFVGIDQTFKQSLLAYNDAGLGGRPVTVARAYFNLNWIQTSILPRYWGIINSISIEDDYPTTPGATDPVSFSVMINLKGQDQILENRIAGRYTNGPSQQVWFPTDTSMDIVPALRDRVITLGREE